MAPSNNLFAEMLAINRVRRRLIRFFVPEEHLVNADEHTNKLANGI